MRLASWSVTLPSLPRLLGGTISLPWADRWSGFRARCYRALRWGWNVSGVLVMLPILIPVGTVYLLLRGASALLLRLDRAAVDYLRDVGQVVGGMVVPALLVGLVIAASYVLRP